MSITIANVANELARLHSSLDNSSKDDLAERYVKQLRHICAERALSFTRAHEGPRAANLFEPEEAALASLLLLCSNVLTFDVHLLDAIARGARRIGQGEGLKAALEGIARGEPWALSISVRHPVEGGERIVCRFVRYENARPNEASEELLTAYGEPLSVSLIIGLREIFEPFAQHALA